MNPIALVVQLLNCAGISHGRLLIADQRSGNVRFGISEWTLKNDPWFGKLKKSLMQESMKRLRVVAARLAAHGNAARG